MADGLSYEVEGLEDVIERLSPREAERALRRGMQAAVLGFRRELTRNLSGAILKRRTGATVNATSTEVQASEDEIVGIITNTARWRWRGKEGSLLAVHEYGATIKARQEFSAHGGYLRFRWGKGKNDYATVREVKIPARKPFAKTFEARKVATVNVLRTSLLRQLLGADKAPTANRIFGDTGATVRRARRAGA